MAARLVLLPGGNPCRGDGDSAIFVGAESTSSARCEEAAWRPPGSRRLDARTLVRAEEEWAEAHQRLQLMAGALSAPAEEEVAPYVRPHGQGRLDPHLPRGVGGERLRGSGRAHHQGSVQLAGRAPPALRQGREATTGGKGFHLF